MQSACAVLFCQQWPARLYHIFPYYFINGMIIRGGGEVFGHQIFVLIFSMTFVRNISHSKTNDNNSYLLQLGCYPVAVVILHVNKTWN